MQTPGDVHETARIRGHYNVGSRTDNRGCFVLDNSARNLREPYRERTTESTAVFYALERYVLDTLNRA